MKNILLIFALILSSTVIAQDWISYKNTDYNFSVSIPEEPKAMSQEVPTQVGNLTMNMFMVDASTNESSSNLVYMIVHTQYPANPEKVDESDVQKMLDGSVDGAVSNVQGKLVFQNKIELEGYPGRETKIEVQGAYMYMNMYVKDDVLYAVQTICMAENDENEEIKKFLNSFKLNKKE